jgi:hypothetical protein
MNKLMMGATVGAMLVAGAGEAQAQRRAAITSAYTDVNLNRCKVLRTVEEGASTEWQCPGLSGTPLMIASGDERFDVDAGVFNEEFESTSPFSSLGPRVEWRLRGGQPFAIIYRLSMEGDGQGDRTVLGVETVGRRGRPGCLVAWIAGSVPNANATARQQADQRAGGFRCGRDRAARIGNVAELVPAESN